MELETFRFLIVLLHISSCGGEYRHSVFTKLTGCPNEAMLPVVPVSTDGVSNLPQCVAMCMDDSSCSSVNVCSEPMSGYACHRLGSISNGSCSDLQPAPGCVYLEPVCKNGGTYNFNLMGCDCPVDFTGAYCERRYYDCSEAYDGGVRVPGSDHRDFYIQPMNSPKEISVECYLAYGGWTTMSRRGDSCTSDPNRTWDEYKAGWIDSCSYWLGLENLHYLTHQAGLECNLDIFVKLSSGVKGQFYYNKITIGDEATNFTLDYGGQWKHSTQAVGSGFVFGGATKGIKGKGFATSDRPDPQGCAVTAGAGWWYGDECPLTNLNKWLSFDPAATNVAKWPDENGNLENVGYQRLQIKVLRP